MESLARQAAIQLGQNNCGRIAIRGFFDVKGRSRRFEKYIEIEFTHRLLRTGRFEIHTPKDLITVEENRLAAIATDGASAGNRLADSTDTKRIELDSSLIGSTIEFPQAVKIGVRIISSRTGSVYGTASVMVHRDRAVESLLDNFGVKQYASFGNPDFRVGEVIKTGENQYVDLIPGEYILYVKQINFEYALFSDRFSNVEIFLNADFRIMKVNDMISITCENERYILALRDVANGAAVFTFAHFNDGRHQTTQPFSLTDKSPYNKEASDHCDANERASSAPKEAETQRAGATLTEPSKLADAPDSEKIVTTPPAIPEKTEGKAEIPKQAL